MLQQMDEEGGRRHVKVQFHLTAVVSERFYHCSDVKTVYHGYLHSSRVRNWTVETLKLQEKPSRNPTVRLRARRRSFREIISCRDLKLFVKRLRWSHDECLDPVFTHAAVSSGATRSMKTRQRHFITLCSTSASGERWFF